MTTYLFFTDPAKYNAEGVDDSGDATWSCSKTCRPGDVALVYLNGGEGITYEWEIASDPKPAGRWRYKCTVRFIRSFDPSIPLSEIVSEFSRAEWAAPHTNFRGMSSIRVPEHVERRLRALRASA